jgi:hypothetical protein
MNVCDGGTISGGVTSITFTNPSTTTIYTITNCVSTSNGQTMPGWPATDPAIPKAQNGVAGTHTVQLAVAAQPGNTYQYTPSPQCPQATAPKIIVQ